MSETSIWRCYHCDAGVSHENPLTAAESLEATVGALKLAAALPPSEEAEAAIARLVADLDRSVHPLAEELRSDPSAGSRIQAALQN